jgi:CubicO group peptidase (beta-lactamase class C family)
MKRVWTSVSVLTLALLVFSLLAGCQTTDVATANNAPLAPVFEVPRAVGITLDGTDQGWGDQGLAVRILRFVEQPKPPAADDFDPSLRLAWDDRGLLLRVAVRDDVNHEFPNIEDLWRGDGVEVFVTRGLGQPETYQVQVGPGSDAAHPLRFYTNDRRPDKEKLAPLKVTAVASYGPGRYTMDLLLPWSNLGITPAVGTELALQVYVNDSDRDFDRKQALWYPKAGAHRDTTLMQRIRLTQQPGTPVLLDAVGWYERSRRTCIGVYGAASLVGQAVTVRDGTQVLAQQRLTDEGGRATAIIALPMPAIGKAWAPLAVEVAGSAPMVVTLPDAKAARMRELLEAELVAAPFCFTGAKLPACDFAQPNLVEDLIGPYTIKPRYFDDQWQEVTSAAKPGRYGAVITVEHSGGPALQRYLTLYRYPGTDGLWKLTQGVTQQTELPSGFGIAPEVLREQNQVMQKYTQGRWRDAAERDGATAVLLAGLAEVKPGAVSAAYGDAFARDRQWWVTLKRRLDGSASAFANTPLTPQKITGAPAPVLRTGTAAEAGMQADAAARIDALCREWAANSDEAFAVCVARRGVIVLHAAYGTRDGKPMTVDTPSWIASITKLLATQLMLQMVDAGVVDLDAPVAQYLPAFRNRSAKRPMTVRDLYVHTAGLWGHWGDDLNDFDQRIADMYPYLPIGVAHEYNGAGYALGSKIVESVTGQALPALYHDRLLGPLGCNNTEATDSGGGVRSVPLDLAKVGQMMLNGGAYSAYRFYDPKTLKLAMPQKLTKTLGADTSKVWGIGLEPYYTKEGLGATTFGHGSATRCIFRVDPEHELVIVMTRNDAGTHYNDYTPKFFQTIMAGIAK